MGLVVNLHIWHSSVRRVLGRLGFADPSAPVQNLSEGWRRRLTLAKAFVKEPDILFLDEPTNHLDLDEHLVAGVVPGARENHIHCNES